MYYLIDKSHGVDVLCRIGRISNVNNIREILLVKITEMVCGKCYVPFKEMSKCMKWSQL